MRRVSSGRLVKAMAFGIIGVIISLAIETVIGLLREDWTNPVGIGLAVVLASASGLLPLLQQEKTPAVAESSQPPVPAPSGHPSTWAQAPTPVAGTPRPARSRVPAVLAVLVLLLLCGGGGGALAYGTQYLGGWVTGNETGPDILVAEASAASGTLTLTVHRVLRTPHYTRVEVGADNRGSVPVTLPVGSGQLTAAGGQTLKGNSLHSDWADIVPAGGMVRGTIAFGPLPADVSTVSLSFTQAYGRGDAAITVTNIKLAPFDAP
jgi:hypothetical protein